MANGNNYTEYAVTEDFKREVIEHGVKIENIQKIVVETDKKIDGVKDEIQQIRVLIASNPSYDPIVSATHSNQIEVIQKKVSTQELTINDLVNSKNRILGALTLGGVFGSIIGIIGTWITTLMLRTPK
jgi:hypothetical protein